MTLPKNVVAVRCDVDTAWKLNKELLEAGVPCLFEEEGNFKESYKGTNDIGLFWGYKKVIIPLITIDAHILVSMPEFRAAFELPIKPKP